MRKCINVSDTNFNSYSTTTGDMEKAIVLLCLLVLVQGRVHNFKTRIVNGADANLGEIPYQVSLQINEFHICGGSILNENYVVTAAHCVEWIKSQLLIVIAGTVNLTEPGQAREVVNITVHKDYSQNDYSYVHDIALLKVNSSFEFSEFVKPVPLPDFHAEVAVNSSTVMSGWGALGGETSQLTEKLKKVQVFIADQEYCREAVKPRGYTLYPTEFCTNDPINEGGECSGDFGGPVTVNGILTGILSWSIKIPYCTEYPGVHTRVAEYIDWISQHAV